MGIIEVPKTRIPVEPEDIGSTIEASKMDPAVVITMARVLLIGAKVVNEP